MVDDHEDYETGSAPAAHKVSHQDGGTDEITVEGLAGELAAEQKSAWAKVSGKPGTFTPSAHKLSHQNGGADEISVAGLAGETAELAAHKILPAIHHVKFTAAEARAAINNIFGADGKADSDIDLDTHKLINVVDPVTDQGGDTKKARNDAISTHAGLPTVHQNAPALIATHAGNATLHHVNYTAVHVYLSAEQDLVSGAITLIAFNLERYDTQNEFNTATHIFTAKTAGKYLITLNAHLSENAAAGTEFNAYILINAAYVAAQRSVEGGAIISGRYIGTVWDLGVDDTVEFKTKVVHTENRKLSTAYTRATITRLL